MNQNPPKPPEPLPHCEQRARDLRPGQRISYYDDEPPYKIHSGPVLGTATCDNRLYNLPDTLYVIVETDDLENEIWVDPETITEFPPSPLFELAVDLAKGQL